MNLASTSAVLNQNVLQPVVTFSGSPQQPLTTDSSGNFIAQITITNTGNITVSSVQVTSATLGAGSLLSAPAAITNLAPGQSAVFTLTFPASSVPAGATTAPLKVSGTLLDSFCSAERQLELELPLSDLVRSWLIDIGQLVKNL